MRSSSTPRSAANGATMHSTPQNRAHHLYHVLHSLLVSAVIISIVRRSPAENASAFENARWEVDYLRVYATKCKAAAAPGAQPRLWFAVVVALGGVWLLL